MPDVLAGGEPERGSSPGRPARDDWSWVKGDDRGERRARDERGVSDDSDLAGGSGPPLTKRMETFFALLTFFTTLSSQDLGLGQ